MSKHLVSLLYMPGLAGKNEYEMDIKGSKVYDGNSQVFQIVLRWQCGGQLLD